MRELIETFFKQSGLSRDAELPAYYRMVLEWTYRLLLVYFLICMVISIPLDRYMLILSAVWAVVSFLMSKYLGRMSIRLNLLSYTALIFFWCYNFVRHYGWGHGGQHFLLPLIIIIFFSVYETGRAKIMYWVLIVLFRMLLYVYTLYYEPIVELSMGMGIFLQVVNTVLLFVHIALICIVLSSSIQATEKTLLINNQELKKEAATDALTGLANRRTMREQMELFLRTERDMPFCLAIADIDFFKKVNDTYGHNCGDYVLKELSALFQKESEGKAYVCRWGGEEFCFFIPYMNLDEAGLLMEQIRDQVDKMTIVYEGQTIHLTITIGLEDYDFRSDLSGVIEKADEKLYMGKNNGRNKLVM